MNDKDLEKSLQQSLKAAEKYNFNTANAQIDDFERRFDVDGVQRAFLKNAGSGDEAQQLMQKLGDLNKVEKENAAIRASGSADEPNKPSDSDKLTPERYNKLNDWKAFEQAMAAGREERRAERDDEAHKREEELEDDERPDPKPSDAEIQGNKEVSTSSSLASEAAASEPAQDSLKENDRAAAAASQKENDKENNRAIQPPPEGERNQENRDKGKEAAAELDVSSLAPAGDDPIADPKEGRKETSAEDFGETSIETPEPEPVEGQNQEDPATPTQELATHQQPKFDSSEFEALKETSAAVDAQAERILDSLETTDGKDVDVVSPVDSLKNIQEVYRESHALYEQQLESAERNGASKEQIAEIKQASQHAQENYDRAGGLLAKIEAGKTPQAQEQQANANKRGGGPVQPEQENTAGIRPHAWVAESVRQPDPPQEGMGLSM
jgi:hypothetical protein